MSDAELPGEAETLSFELGSPAASAPGGYRVLARKYRPQTFDDLIGQEPMVRTLTNAFEQNRIPQAWILTGVRGVGKTTTARIIARALNYEAPGAPGRPTVVMPTLGVHCQAIIESRHVDVIEMDAASHNGVDDIRQINDAVRYAPAQARYKVYILDEVHMLSGAAFNALLKTLEEPPPHVKFVFATTDIRKVPVTVLSRCQRFDLRRVEASTLIAHLSRICAKEEVEVEADALSLIARAAEGSVRDALSLLDQAIAHAAGRVSAEDVRRMLGLADRARIIDLFDALMRGDAGRALAELRDQYDAGADPAVALTDLADFTHFVTRIKVLPARADDASFAEIERVRGRDLAASLSLRVLSRTWQMLLKGIAEVQGAAKPLAAAEMVLVRIAYAADLPAPEDLVRSLAPGVAAPSSPSPGHQAAAPPAPRAGAALAARANPAPTLHSDLRPHSGAAMSPETATPRALLRFEDIVAIAAEKRDLVMKTALERDVRPVRVEEGRLEIALEPGASKALANDLARKLSQWTGRRWMVIVSAEPGEPTLRARAESARAEIARGVQAHPLVQAVMARFPGAEITRVTPRGAETSPSTYLPIENETAQADLLWPGEADDEDAEA
ncbi:MAG TPA: DNA polymerase III subunit gamma/tau [Xanthobacteraceae bacterium]|nr:DNA polymerase III subunit gamma/tau [Xanthobacteraceae bacterium]